MNWGKKKQRWEKIRWEEGKPKMMLEETMGLQQVKKGQGESE